MLLAESNHVSFVYEENECSLVVLSAGNQDGGVYTCTARNLAGEVSCKAELSVLSGGLVFRGEEAGSPLPLPAFSPVPFESVPHCPSLPLSPSCPPNMGDISLLPSSDSHGGRGGWRG